MGEPLGNPSSIQLHAADSIAARRSVVVYLPPGYASDVERRYPVLYLHDGQNLFDAATAFLGNPWKLHDVVEASIKTGEIRPLILVGIYNRGEKRVLEYTHVRHAGNGGGGRAYGRLIVNELKPFIDREYRTLADARNTGLGGSSLGGLVTLYLGLQHARVFGNLIVMSPSVWWAQRAILKDVEQLKRKPESRIWLDTGTCEGHNPQECVAQAAALRDALIGKGWRLGHDLAYLEDEGAAHDEKAWGSRMRDALRFLFPPLSGVLRAEGDSRKPER